MFSEHAGAAQPLGTQLNLQTLLSWGMPGCRVEGLQVSVSGVTIPTVITIMRVVVIIQIIVIIVIMTKIVIIVIVVRILSIV